MTSGETHFDATARTAAAATIARVLEQIGGVQPERMDFDTIEDGTVVARVVLDQDVCELWCTLSGEGDLISARLIEL